MPRSYSKLNRIVVKIGSSSLLSDDNQIHERQIIELSRQISKLVQGGMELVLVSSGAVAAGRGFLNQKSSSLDNFQAAAAVGQPILMALFQKYFQAYDIATGQLLLTHDDFQSRRRYLNARNTIHSLMANGIIPIINENDSISTEEIRFSDNDFLGALCTNLVSADLFIILSNIDGIADKNPKLHPDAKVYQKLSLVELEGLKEKINDDQVEGVGRGGISTKLEAPMMAARYGVPTVIANSRTEDVLTRIIQGEEIGTYVEPIDAELNSWRAYIAHALKPKAMIIIDEGAAKALKQSKASLLSSGIIGIRGKFNRGDGVRCCLQDGTEVVQGIVEYDESEVNKIAGCQSSEIEKILGYRHRRSVIHRENMVRL